MYRLVILARGFGRLCISVPSNILHVALPNHVLSEIRLNDTLYDVIDISVSIYETNSSTLRTLIYGQNIVFQYNLNALLSMNLIGDYDALLTSPVC